MTIYRADSAGDVDVSFSDPSGQGTLFSTYVQVWRPQISVGANEAVKSIGFAESAQGAQSAGTTASVPVQQDDLLLAIGLDTHASTPGEMTLSGPSSQLLVDFNPAYANRTSRMKLWRIKSTTNASVNYVRCNAGRSLIKLVPNVEVVQTEVPVADEPVIYVEIQPELTSSGRVLRPRWFDALRTSYAWSYSTGLRKRWMKEAASSDDAGARARIVELWKFPEAARTSVPTNEAFTYTNFTTAEARVIHHDLGW